MKDLRRRFDRFCIVNRNKGIPNLMLYICIGCAIFYFLALIDPSKTLIFYALFIPDLIKQGEIWRLFSYVFIYLDSNPITTAITLLCTYYIGRTLEQMWGTLKLNLFYFGGIIAMDVFCLITNTIPSITYLNTAMLLCFATMMPDAQFLLMYIIPIKAWIFAWLSIAMMVYYIFSPTPYCPVPLIPLALYLLFVGRDVMNIIPDFLRPKKRPASKPAGHKTIQFKTAAQKADFTHKCTVCGRTDISDPQLEFRYCSRCKGYYCYCEEHISNHAHIQ